MSDQRLILGPPGCGKTFSLLDRIEKEFANGIRPNKVLFSAFTKKGSNEAIVRSCAKFGFRRADIPYFRTIHSLAFQEMHIGREDVMQMKDYKNIGAAIGLDFGYSDIEDGMPAPSANVGDQMLYTLGLARSRMVTPEEQYKDSDFEFSWFEFDRFIKTLDNYKQQRGLVDFSDMIDLYIRDGAPIKIDVAVIDEAQDLSKQQWIMVRKAISLAQRIYIAGDDDQSIFRWSGADIDQFLSLTGERDVLGHSFRLPRSVYDVAVKISARIGKRFDKPWTPRNEDGRVDYVSSIHDIEIRDGTNLFLVRNKFLLATFERFLRTEGYPYTTARGSSINPDAVLAIKIWEQLRKGQSVPVESIRLAYAYLKIDVGVQRGFKSLKGASGNLTMPQLRKSWGLLTGAIWHDALTELEDKEYYLAALRRGEKLDAAPRIHISTIHAVKGGEADHVIIMTDCSWKTYEGFRRNPDDEHRVYYVGVTRAKQTLQILAPQTNFAYDVP